MSSRWDVSLRQLASAVGMRCGYRLGGAWNRMQTTALCIEFFTWEEGSLRGKKKKESTPGGRWLALIGLYKRAAPQCAEGYVIGEGFPREPGNNGSKKPHPHRIKKMFQSSVPDPIVCLRSHRFGYQMPTDRPLPTAWSSGSTTLFIH